MRYFVELQYDGSAYCGWQRQPNQPSVQQCIEQALSTLLRCPTEIVGAGRTDTGVNASYYVAHFDTEDRIANIEQLVYKLNKILPTDIAILGIEQVADDAHARFDAVEREYTYVITTSKSPFMRHTSWYYNVPLNIDRMNEAAAALLEYEDFTSFAKLGSNNTTNLCQIYEALWWREGTTLRFRIRANRFLRNMVRAIVGTLIDVGRGRYTVEEFREIIESRDLSRCSTGAPAQGLFLSNVKYKGQMQ